MATTAIASSLAKKARNASAADSGRACFNGRSRKDECDNGVPSTAKSRVHSMQLIHYGDR